MNTTRVKVVALASSPRNNPEIRLFADTTTVTHTIFRTRAYLIVDTTTARESNKKGRKGEKGGKEVKKREGEGRELNKHLNN